MTSTNSDPTPIRVLIRQSRSRYEKELLSGDREKIVRRRLRKLAVEGDLWMLATLLDGYLKGVANRLLEEDLSPQGVENVRGQIVGIRNFFQDLLDDGEFPEEPVEQELVPNPLERLLQDDVAELMVLTELR